LDRSKECKDLEKEILALKKDYSKINEINEETSERLKESANGLKKEKMEKENLMAAYKQMEEDFLNNAKNSVFIEETEKESARERAAAARLVLQLKTDLGEYEDELR
jgi:hypothetical protein